MEMKAGGAGKVSGLIGFTGNTIIVKAALLLNPLALDEIWISSRTGFGITSRKLVSLAEIPLIGIRSDPRHC